VANTWQNAQPVCRWQTTHDRLPLHVFDPIFGAREAGQPLILIELTGFSKRGASRHVVLANDHAQRNAKKALNVDLFAVRQSRRPSANWKWQNRINPRVPACCNQNKLSNIVGKNHRVAVGELCSPGDTNEIKTVLGDSESRCALRDRAAQRRRGRERASVAYESLKTFVLRSHEFWSDQHATRVGGSTSETQQ